MKRVVLCLVITLLTGLSLSMPAHAADPVSITTCAQLQAIDDDPSINDGDYVLASDINCSGIDFEPLTFNSAFVGSLDGQGHTIRNLFIDKTGEDYIGLFKVLGVGAYIHSINFRGGLVQGDSNLGVVAGQATSSDIDNIHSDIDVTGTTSSIGGLVGIYYAISGPSVTASNNSSSGNVTGARLLGGLYGFASAQVDGSNMTIENSFATGDITGTDPSGFNIGGLIGHLNPGAVDADSEMTIEDSFATGDISAAQSNNVGGLIGFVQMGSNGAGNTATLNIDRTYATGDLSGDLNVGGLIGNGGSLTSEDLIVNVSNSFSAANVSATNASNAGNFLGIYGSSDHAINSTNNHYYYPENGLDCSGSDAPFSNCTAQDTYEHFFDTSNDVFTTWDFGGSPWYDHSSYYFPTLVADDDFDGLSTEDEQGSPNNNDMNNDGKLDIVQTNVAAVHVGKGDWGAIVVAGGTLENVSQVSTGDFTTQDDEGYAYKYDFLNFSAIVPVGESASVTLIYYTSDMAADIGVRKYNPNTEEYFDVIGAEIADVDIEGEHTVQITYNITDGGDNDGDGTENGFVTDPVNIYTGGPTALPTTTTPGGQAGNEVAVGSLPTTGAQTFSIIFTAMLLIGFGFVLKSRFAKKQLL